MTNLRIGAGFDAHAFSGDRKLILGGAIIPFSRGLAGHSDADVLTHAIIDSLLGPSNLGDIGTLFPDTNDEFKDISSLILLEKVCGLLHEKRIEIINIDSIVICEKPKIKDYVNEMKRNISKSLNSLPEDRISIKGKTTEKLGFAGRGEGIAAQAVSLITVGS